MTKDDWSKIITKITPYSADSIDDILEGHDARFVSGGVNGFDIGERHFATSPFSNPSTACIAVRVSTDNDDKFDLSMKLAALALEKEVTPIIFNYCDYSGLEKFGFRVEKISGNTAAEIERCEAQLKAFWNISVVI